MNGGTFNSILRKPGFLFSTESGLGKNAPGLQPKA